MMRATYITGTNPEFYDVLREDAAGSETTWTISRHARRNDRVLLYVCAPVMAIVARAIMAEDAALVDDPASEWHGHHMADMHSLTLLAEPVTRRELLAAFPAWGYWKQPRNSVRVPEAYGERLTGLIVRARP